MGLRGFGFVDANRRIQSQLPEDIEETLSDKASSGQNSHYTCFFFYVRLCYVARSVNYRNYSLVRLNSLNPLIYMKKSEEDLEMSAQLLATTTCY